MTDKRRELGQDEIIQEGDILRTMHGAEWETEGYPGQTVQWARNFDSNIQGFYRPLSEDATPPEERAFCVRCTHTKEWHADGSGPCNNACHCRAFQPAPVNGQEGERRETFDEWWIPYDANQEWWGQSEKEIAIDAWQAGRVALHAKYTSLLSAAREMEKVMVRINDAAIRELEHVFTEDCDTMKCKVCVELEKASKEIDGAISAFRRLVDAEEEG